MDLRNFDEAISLHYSLLENTEAIPRNDGSGNGSIRMGTTTHEETFLPHQTPIKVEMTDLALDLCINDEDFYQQSGIRLGEPSNEKEMVMPTDSCGDAFLVPSVPNAIIKVESCTDVDVDVGAVTSQVETLPESEPGISQLESMLLDPMFSEMDVSSLIELNEAEKSFNYHHDSSLTETVPRIIRRRGKRKFIQMAGNADEPGDTSGSEVRRSNRKRNVTEVFKVEVPSVPKIKRGRPVKLIRKKLPVKGQAKRKRAPRAKRIPAVQQIVEAPEPEMLPEPEEEKMEEEEEETECLNIILRRYAPVNPLKHPIGKKKYSMRLIRGREHISAELYFARTIEPKSLPYSCIFPESDGKEHFGPTQVAGDIFKVKELMRMEWITNYNLIGNYRAHGQQVLDEAEEEITPDGNGLKGTIHLLNIDELYDDLLDRQESIVRGPEIELKVDEGDVPLESASTAASKLHNDFFLNEFNFSNDYFEDNNYYDSGEWDGPDFDDDEITGASPIKKEDLNLSCDDYLSKHTVFRYKDKLYKVNHPKVIVVRTPDELIAQIKAPVQKVTFASPYYSALTSYFDKKEEEKANAQDYSQT